MTCDSCLTPNPVSADVCSACKTPLGIAAGSVVAGRYVIDKLLGRGGMGVIYKAWDKTLDETVALKTLRPHIAKDADMVRRFRAEIRMARRIRHRNVCAIHDYGEDGELLYISMEFIDGVDVKHLIRENGPFPPIEGFAIAMQLADGLSAIHEAGIVHRDLKAHNVIRDPRGIIKLLDFGIAKQQDAETSMTATGQIVGTPEYMSPEQVKGGDIDGRSDLYALGVVTYELFTGQVPFTGDTPMVTIFKHLREAPLLEGPGAEAIPPALVPVLRKSLAKEPAERYATAAEMAEALRLARNEALPEVAPLPYFETASREGVRMRPGSETVPPGGRGTVPPGSRGTVPPGATVTGAPPPAPVAPSVTLAPVTAAPAAAITPAPAPAPATVEPAPPPGRKRTNRPGPQALPRPGSETIAPEPLVVPPPAPAAPMPVTPRPAAAAKVGPAPAQVSTAPTPRASPAPATRPGAAPAVVGTEETRVPARPVAGRRTLAPALIGVVLLLVAGAGALALRKTTPPPRTQPTQPSGARPAAPPSSPTGETTDASSEPEVIEEDVVIVREPSAAPPAVAPPAGGAQPTLVAAGTTTAPPTATLPPLPAATPVPAPTPAPVTLAAALPVVTMPPVRTAPPAPPAPPRTLVAGATSARSGKAAKGSMSGFDTGGQEVLAKPEFDGRIEFVTTPSSVRPGDPHRIQVFVTNTGKGVKLQSVQLNTSVDGRSTARLPPLARKELGSQQRLLLDEITGAWPAVEKWSLEAVVTTTRGDTVRATLGLR